MEKIKENWLEMVASTILIIVAVIVAWLLIPLMSVSDPGNISSQESINDGLAYVEGVTYYPMKGEVVNAKGKNVSIGVASQTYEVNFGRAPTNSSVTKIIILEAPKPGKIRLYKFGNISEKVKIPKDFWLESRKEIKLRFNSTTTGNYTGVFAVESLIPKNWLARQVLRWS